MNRSNAQFCNKSLMKEEVDIESGGKITFQHDTSLLNPATFVGNFQLNDTNVLYDDEHTDADNEADDDSAASTAGAGMLQNKDQMSILNENTYVAPLTVYPFQNYTTQQQRSPAPVPSYEMLMGPPPPSTTNLGYNFDYTVQEQRRAAPNYTNMYPTAYHQNYPPQMTNNQHMLSPYNSPNSMKQQSAQYSGGTRYTQPATSSSFYNKIWYPNAAHNRPTHEIPPALSNNRSCNTLRSNIYYNGPSCSHADPMLDMLQLSNR